MTLALVFSVLGVFACVASFVVIGIAAVLRAMGG